MSEQDPYEEEFLVLQEFAKAAKQKLSQPSWDYLMGGAETETTLNRNRLAIDSLAFRPRVLRDVRNVDAGGTLFGHRLRLPVLLAPIGSLQDFTAGGGVVPTKAAARFGAMHMLSSTCQPGLEEVAGAVDYPKIFQLYVRGDGDFVDDHIKRAIDAGYVGFCFTVDLDAYGRRERDLAKRYKTTARKGASGEINQLEFSWDDIKRIRDTYDIPLILKGIATGEDAELAVIHGIDAVYVSNHGGRQLDHGRGGLEVLPEIVEAVSGNAEIIFDGGIMRGSDVVKAIALGADVVGIGRLQGLAAAAGDEDGIVRMLEILETEIVGILRLLGVCSFDELDETYLHTGNAVRAARPLSAFPLLDEGY
jgi:isopentenyl diphosphate isomerase/L-lactate dehydrogenase-like FMN-dependent dehydrogenase